MNYDEGIITLLQQSEELKTQGRNDEAIKLLQGLLMEAPECIEAYEEIGDNYLSLQQPDKAKKALKQALKLNPRSSNAHYLLGFLLSMQEDWTTSVEELTMADEIAPNHPEILRCLGWAVYNANRRTQGISLLERSRNLSPFDPNILCDLGVCYMNSLQHDQAEKVFKKALELDPNSDQAKECLAVLEAMKSGLDMAGGTSDQRGNKLSD